MSMGTVPDSRPDSMEAWDPGTARQSLKSGDHTQHRYSTRPPVQQELGELEKMIDMGPGLRE